MGALMQGTPTKISANLSADTRFRSGKHKLCVQRIPNAQFEAACPVGAPPRGQVITSTFENVSQHIVLFIHSHELLAILRKRSARATNNRSSP
jgi:hypothetical protein